MIEALPALLTSGTALPLLAQAAALPDTIVTISASPTGLQRWIDVLTSIASIVIALALIAIAIPLIPAAWNSRKMHKKVQGILGQIRSDVDPIVKHARDAAENVNYLTTAVRADAERVQRLVADSQMRLERAADEAERRIADFNALLKVMQEEAEDLFIGTASTLRGVRAGTEAFRDLGPDEWDEELEETEISVERRNPT